MKKIVMLCTLLSIVQVTQTALREYDFSNFLSEPIVIRINQSRADNKDYYQIVGSFETVKQVFDNAFCLEQLAWAPWDNKKPLHGGADLVDTKTGRIPEENQRKFGDQVAPRYAFSRIEIKMLPNEVFKKTAAAATKLLKGIDNMACQVLNEVKSFTGSSLGDTLGSTLGSANDLLSQSNILDGLQGALTGGTASAFVSGNISELSKIFTPDELSKLKMGAKGGLKDQITEIMKKAKEKVSKTHIDLEHSVIKTSVDAHDAFIQQLLNESTPSTPGASPQQAANKAPLKDPNKCSFGLSKIADGASKLVKTTLCKSKKFLLYPKMDKDDLPILNAREGYRIIVQAFTGEGE